MTCDPRVKEDCLNQLHSMPLFKLTLKFMKEFVDVGVQVVDGRRCDCIDMVN